MKHSRPYLIGVCGGSGSGKSTICQELVKSLSDNYDVGFINQDWFYKDLAEEQQLLAANNEYNFDSLDSIDLKEFKDCLMSILNFNEIQVPQYDFTTHSRLPTRHVLKPHHIYIIEGFLLLASEDVRTMLDLKVFVDADADIRLCRRLSRDISSRGRTLGSVIEQYLKFTRPCHSLYVEPFKKYADITINNGISSGTKTCDEDVNNSSIILELIRKNINTER